jgi:Mg2+ and Co2+ transporter CorA
MMTHDGHVLIILHELPDPEEPEIRVGKLFWRQPNGEWRSTGSPLRSIEPLRNLMETFLRRSEELEEQIESAATAADYFGVLHRAAPFLRTARNLSRTLQEARQAAGADKDLIGIRDAAQDTERAAELIHAYAKDGLDFTIAKNAEQNAQNTEHVIRSGHQLNLLAALFLPITAVGSLLGMNLVHGFETWHAPWTFWCVAGISFALGFWIKSALPRPKS